jgi:hypothetical protein
MPDKTKQANKFDRLDDLDLLVEPFKSLIKRLILLLVEKKLTFKVLETYRTQERQDALYKARNSRIKRSKHQDGIACDFVHLVKGKIDWLDMKAYQEFGKCVKSFKELTWGGEWRTFKDFVHVELKNEYIKKRK